MDLDAAFHTAPPPSSLVGARSLRVMVIEDDPQVGAALAKSLERVGMQVLLAGSGAAAVGQKAGFGPDVVLVDLELPDTCGTVLIKWLVEQQDCGVIVVSGSADDTDRVIGLELGADDYVAKPPVMRELIARIRAVNRRIAPRQGGASHPIVRFGGFGADLAARIVYRANGERISLTSTEYGILEVLINAAGQVVTREQLSKAALKRPWQADDRSIDQLVFGLRRKLGNDINGQSPIQSIRGSGYLLCRADRTSPPSR